MAVCPLIVSSIYRSLSLFIHSSESLFEILSITNYLISQIHIGLSGVQEVLVHVDDRGEFLNTKCFDVLFWF